MKLRTRLIFMIVALFLGVVFVAPHARAGDLQFSPAVIDITGQPRDSFPMDITVTNGGKRPMEVYPYIGEFNPKDGSVYMPSGPTENHQLASTWTEIPREGFTLDPGESKMLPFKITIDTYAEPHDYYVAVGFPEGDNMYAAHEQARSADRIIATVRVTNPVVHSFSLMRFAPLKRAFLGFPASFEAVIVNGGNAPDTMGGVVRLFDRKGSEVGQSAWTVGDPLAVDGKKELVIDWGGNDGFGRYKAFFEARYGEKNEALITDTAYFWVLPWYVLAALLAVVLVISMSAAWWAHRYRERRHS